MIQAMKKAKTGNGSDNGGKNRYPAVRLNDMRTTVEKLRQLSVVLEGLVARASALGIDSFDKISGGARLASGADDLAGVIGEISGKVTAEEMRRGRFN